MGATRLDGFPGLWDEWAGRNPPPATNCRWCTGNSTTLLSRLSVKGERCRRSLQGREKQSPEGGKAEGEHPNETCHHTGYRFKTVLWEKVPVMRTYSWRLTAERRRMVLWNRPVFWGFRIILLWVLERSRSVPTTILEIIGHHKKWTSSNWEMRWFKFLAASSIN